MRPKARFLTVVWGDAYIERFANLALPSFLAKGNLPALAAACDLEVVIMTTRHDVEGFETHAAFRTLRSVCAVRFMEIDDLIAPGIYGVTLTLAYMRAIASAAADMVNTYFIFMNADFVLADGSLRSLSKHILAGRAIILGPSFRATAEAIEPRLRARVEHDSSTLTVSPRELVRMALAHPHPTTLAKTLNQGLCHSREPNQFFWQVDSETVLARYYLIFMLCLKPERAITAINSYCDYSFIPEMCPSGDEIAMGDSDEFFMLELQRHEHEMDYLRFGRPSEQAIAASLSKWATAEHRRAATRDIVFHAGPVPASIEQTKTKARAFIEQIDRQLGQPVSHVGHPFWVGALHWFASIRAEQGSHKFPAELSEAGLPKGWSMTQPAASSVRTFALAISQLLRLLLTAAYKRIMGMPPFVTPLSPHWLDYLHLRQTLNTILKPEGTILLIVRERREFIDALLKSEKRVRFATVSDVLLSGLPVTDPVTSVLFYLRHNELRYMQRLIEVCTPALAAQSAWHAFIHRSNGAIAPEDLLFDMVHYLEEAVGKYTNASVCSCVGGRTKTLMNSIFGWIARQYVRFGILSMLWAAPVLLLSLPVTLLSNLYFRSRLPTSHFLRGSTSVLIRFS